MTTKAIQSLYSPEEIKEIENFIKKQESAPGYETTKTKLQKVSFLKYIRES